MDENSLNDVEIEPLTQEGLEEAAGGVRFPLCSLRHCSAPDGEQN